MPAQLSRCHEALKYTGIYQISNYTLKNALEATKKKVLWAIASLTQEVALQKQLKSSAVLSYEATNVAASLIFTTSTKKWYNLPQSNFKLYSQLEKYIPSLAAYGTSLIKAGVQNADFRNCKFL
ncbi:hypothetical protein [Sporomusa carbonis]|uniref:hypothetical protein n=1 Tax=Sporomusa carbonis TaxID=3076075 RepID=UPI003C7EB090